MTKPALNNPVLRDGTRVPIYPIGPRVLIERMEDEEVQTAAGLLLPGSSKEETNYGVVIAAGPAALDVLHDAGIEVGDRIAFGRFAGERLKWRVDGDKNPLREAYMIDVKDIWGCAELADRIASGEWVIGNLAEDGQNTQFRFGRIEKKELQPTGNPGEFVGTPIPDADEIREATIADTQRELSRLQKQASLAHQKQDIETYEALCQQMAPLKQSIKRMGGSI